MQKNIHNIKFQMQCRAKRFVVNHLHVCAFCASFAMTEPTPGREKPLYFIVWGLIAPNYVCVTLLCLHIFRGNY